MTGTTGKIDQYALVAFLIKQAAQVHQQLGKKALQKKVHLIQEFGGVDTGYRFSFYTYGPYAVSLAGDLDVIANSGGAKIRYVSWDNHYLIGPDENTDRMIERGQKFLEKNQIAIDKVLTAFGSRSAKGLELVSTIAYLRRHAPKEEFEDNGKLVRHVKALKPKYSEMEVESAIDEVRGFLSR